MNIETLSILILGIILSIMLIIIIYNEPVIVILTTKYIPKTFRLYKPKNENYYYLQVRVMYRYYYIYKTKDDYDLTFSLKKYNIRYPNHWLLLLDNDAKIYDEKYKVITFFSEESSPEDVIDL